LRSCSDCSDSLKDQLVADFRSADITEQDKLILEFAEKLTLDAASTDRTYIDRLREHGFDDRALHDIVQVAAYFNYINRLADGLGVELEKD
jgi:uncharacterized peroxidase-related enzyme